MSVGASGSLLGAPETVVGAQVPCPRTRSTATIHLEMVDAAGLVFTDDFALSFHMHFHRLLKWLVAAPFLACAAAVLSLRLDNIQVHHITTPSDQP